MWVLIALVGLVIVMSRWARVETRASGNRLSAAEAALAARAGEQYALSMVVVAAGDATFSQVTLVPSEVPVGAAWFWIARSDRNNDGVQDFGVEDEGAKLNINTAPATTLLMLPGMTPEVADAIVDWRDQDDTPSPYGAENEYYGSLQPPYRAKNAPFDTVEELLLVKGVTPELLYGLDANRNGLLDEEEEAAAGRTGLGITSSLSAANDGSRGWLPFLSVTGPGNAASGGTGGQQAVNVNGNAAQVVQVLQGSITDQNRLSEITNRLQGGRPFRNMIDFIIKTQMKPEEFALVADRLTVAGGAANNARVNVNTAPREVLRCLNGLEDSDALALVTAREGGADTTNLAWVAGAIDPAKAVALGDQITGKSYRYSADVIGVSADGRAYHRVRVMIDATASTPTVTHRRDLTDSGWSLGWDVREAIRSGVW
jgi:DNA uptake protein ComE-like DNA-binding protein